MQYHRLGSHENNHTQLSAIWALDCARMGCVTFSTDLRATWFSVNTSVGIIPQILMHRIVADILQQKLP